jgi:predicted XRE-type DNA-binding protein
MSRKNTHRGSSFRSWLEEEGIADDIEEAAVKAVVAWQLQQAMKAQHLSKKALAEKLGTSRSEVYRLLDPNNEAVSLATLRRAAAAIGKRLKIALVDAA